MYLKRNSFRVIILQLLLSQEEEETPVLEQHLKLFQRDVIKFHEKNRVRSSEKVLLNKLQCLP